MASIMSRLTQAVAAASSTLAEVLEETKPQAAKLENIPGLKGMGVVSQDGDHKKATRIRVVHISPDCNEEPEENTLQSEIGVAREAKRMAEALTAAGKKVAFNMDGKQGYVLVRSEGHTWMFFCPN